MRKSDRLRFSGNVDDDQVLSTISKHLAISIRMHTGLPRLGSKVPYQPLSLHSPRFKLQDRTTLTVPLDLSGSRRIRGSSLHRLFHRLCRLQWLDLLCSSRPSSPPTTCSPTRISQSPNSPQHFRAIPIPILRSEDTIPSGLDVSVLPRDCLRGELPEKPGRTYNRIVSLESTGSILQRTLAYVFRTERHWSRVGRNYRCTSLGCSKSFYYRSHESAARRTRAHSRARHAPRIQSSNITGLVPHLLQPHSVRIGS